MFRNKHIVRRGAPHKETILFLGLAVILAFFLLLLTCFLDICHVRNESSNSFCYVSSQCQNLPRIVELFDCECLEQIIADQPGCSSYYTVPPVQNIYRNSTTPGRRSTTPTWSPEALEAETIKEIGLASSWTWSRRKMRRNRRNPSKRDGSRLQDHVEGHQRGLWPEVHRTEP
ncbi:unnamed protein product [Lepeophtheirus salmonis]|uniref:(salmon louse) hypothetical protein n=1 Tax=Lepeophtheirus salmonis TaxID=72036 RepID=A0A7R8CWX5_LEPSM|nr:unnamed protein product [Lepeophtheirus salmonis]CAF2956842.1 unnamed protein product [Lepeophtheirus salmonis]